MGVKQRVLFLIKNTIRKARSNHVIANDWISKKIRDYKLGFYLGEWLEGVDREKESRLSYRRDKRMQER